MSDVKLLLNRVLDATALRSEALAANIANVNTDGYKRRDVQFLDELKAAVNAGSPKALQQFSPTITRDQSTTRISLEEEFAAISENQLLYTTSADILSRKYASIRRAIKGQ